MAKPIEQSKQDDDFDDVQQEKKKFKIVMKPYHEIEDYGDGKDAIKIDKYGNQTYQV